MSSLNHLLITLLCNSLLFHRHIHLFSFYPTYLYNTFIYMYVYANIFSLHIPLCLLWKVWFYSVELDLRENICYIKQKMISLLHLCRKIIWIFSSLGTNLCLKINHFTIRNYSYYWGYFGLPFQRLLIISICNFWDDNICISTIVWSCQVDESLK